MIVLDVRVPEVPVHVSPFPVTLHEAAFEVDHVMREVPPDGTRRGDAEMEPVIAAVMQLEAPGEQNCGKTQVARFVVEQSVLVCVMVCEPAPVQLHDWGQETVAVTPAPALNCVVPPRPVQLPVYVVVCDGDTFTLPDVAPPVEKLFPVQLVAYEDDHVSVVDCPCVIELGIAVSVAVGGGLSTAQLAYAYVPESVPFEQLRDCETHDEPYGTVAASYAVTLDP